VTTRTKKCEEDGSEDSDRDAIDEATQATVHSSSCGSGAATLDNPIKTFITRIIDDQDKRPTSETKLFPIPFIWGTGLIGGPFGSENCI
jgi:hypothetical protein